MGMMRPTIGADQEGRIIILLMVSNPYANDEVETKDEDEVQVAEQEEDFKPVKGDLLVVQRVLNAQIDVSDEQRENIFHTRCQIRDKVCGMIIDNGSCTNVASTTLVEKLGLTTLPHPRPYSLR